MYLARVIGTVVATKKADNMTGLKLLVVEPVEILCHSEAVRESAQAAPGSRRRLHSLQVLLARPQTALLPRSAARYPAADARRALLLVAQ